MGTIFHSNHNSTQIRNNKKKKEKIVLTISRNCKEKFQLDIKRDTKSKS